MNRNAFEHTVSPAAVTTRAGVAKRNRELRNAVLAVLAAAAMSPAVIQRVEAAPTACTPKPGDPSTEDCTGNQSQGVSSTGDFDPNIVHTLNVHDLTTAVTPTAPKSGVQYGTITAPLNIPFATTTVNVVGTAGAPININSSTSSAVFVETFSGNGSNGASATSGFLCAGADSADEGDVGATGNHLTVNLSHVNTATINANGIRAANGAGAGGKGGDGSMCYSSEAGGVGGTGASLTVAATDTNVALTRTGLYIPGFSPSLAGISASSSGGNGGHGGDGGAFRYGSRGGIGGAGGTVTLSGTGTITTHGINVVGIYAVSVGGNGGDGGSSSGFGGGGNGPYGAGGGLVHVDSGFDITTSDSYSYGIGAYSLGGHGGNGGDGTFFNPSAGNGGGSGNSGDVWVHSSGEIKTGGNFSYGIVAQSIAGYAGSGGSSNSVVNFGSNGGSAGKGGRVDVFNDGKITTTGQEAHAIFAESIGGGGGSGGGGFGAFYAAGGVGGSGGNGGQVFVTNTAEISATGLDARGIYAQSIGGAGGDGGDSIGIAALGGRGSDTSDGDKVSVTNSGKITSAAHAIFAESIGGGGGNGGDSGGWFSVGGGGGAGGKGGVIYVENHGALTTKQDGSSAIFAHSIGGGGGNGGSSIGAGIGGAIAIGGNGANGGDANTVTVKSDTGNIVTGVDFVHGNLGNGSNGIFAQSVGGGGGNGGFAFAGAVGPGAALALSMGGSGAGGGAGKAVDVTAGNSITTHGDDANAIYAESVGGGGGSGGFSVSVSGSNGLGGSFAVGGNGGGGGQSDTVKVASSGTNLQTFGDRSSGIVAQSVGGGGGNGGLAVAGAFSISLTGSATAAFALGGHGGGGGASKDVSVESSSNISTAGDDSHGLFAQSIGGGGGNGGFAVAGSITTGDSINAAFGGVGGGGGNAGAVNVGKTAFTTGVIHTKGDGSDGLVAQSVGGGGGNGGFAIAGGISLLPSVSLAVGGDGGDARNGDAVLVRTANTVITEGNDAHGVFAQSIGGGGGSGGFAVAGGISATGAISAGLGGKGAHGGSASTVTVSNIGDSISTFGEHSYGLLAQSVGGGGGDGGFSIAGGVTQGVSANLALGGSGGDAGIARDVFVTSTSAISTQGDNSHALFVQSVGGGGGSGGFAVTGGISVSGGSLGAALGGSGAGGGKSGRVFLNTIADGTGNITTQGNHSTGILAQSVGGGGGDGGFSIAGSITNGPSANLSIGGGGGTGSNSDIVFVNSGSSVSTHGDDSHGIFAQSLGGGGGDGGFAISGALSATGSIGASLGGSGAGGGNAKDVTLLSSGAAISTVGTHSYGIVAQSVGGGGGDGGFSVAGGISNGATANLSLGGSGSGGGVGAGVYVENSTSISTQGIDSHGLFAQSVGGGGGSGGFSVAAGISKANASVALGGKGAGGGDGGPVTLKSTATSIATAGDRAYGVIAQSLGGGGGDGGFSVVGNISQNSSAGLSLGGSGSGGGNGHAVSLTSSTNIMTVGDDSHGLFAQSLGGGGGSGGFSVAGTIGGGGATASIGGSGAGGGNADAVTLFNNAALIRTAGDRAYGVVAQSVGGGGGDGGFSVAGSISKGPAANFSMGGSGAHGGTSSDVILNSSSAVTTHGDDAHAIFAQSVGGGGGSGGFSVGGDISSDSNTVTASVGGSGAGGGTAGKVSLGTVSAIDGVITTSGDRSYGILAQSIGGGGGDGGFSVAGGIEKGDSAKFSMGGGGGSGSNSDVVSVRSAATIATTGDESHGLFAQSVGGGGGSGGFSVAGSISTQGHSIDASIGGFGAGGGNAKAVSVNNLGASIETGGDRAYGIVAQSIGGGGGDGGFSVAGSISKSESASFSLGGFGDVGGSSGAVSVLSSSDITTHGDESHAIFAQSLGGGGGSGGFSVAGSMFAANGNKPTLDASIGGFGKGGGNADTVTVGVANNVVVGNIFTEGAGSYGIFAQSLGGGGGNGGFSVVGGVNKSPAVRFSLGGFADGGGNGAAVNVFTGATLTTLGDNAHGVFAQSLGGGGGNGGFSISGSATTDTTSVNASVGGKGGGGGIGGDVGVTNLGSITTVGNESVGVFAQSIGGGGGNGGFAVSGSLTGPPSGAVTKKPSRNIEFSLGGFGGNADRGGNVTVANSGAIETYGSASHAILAQSQGGGGGDGGFAGSGTLSILTPKSAQTRATIATSVGGDGGSGNIGGDVGVTNTKDITTHGNDARGIYAYSVGGGGGIGGASYAIDVALGKVENNNGLNLELAVGGFGGDGNVGGAIGVNNAGRIVTSGGMADGIYAQSVGGGGGNGGQSQAASFDFTKAAKPPKTKGGDSWNVTAAIGGYGGDANDGGKVSVTNSGSIETSGFYARGIVAQSVGGGGGNGANAIQGTGIDAIDNITEVLDLRDKNFLKNLFDLRSWTITVGGSGGANGDGKDVNVVNSGSIVTHGLDSFGIFAQSIGGGGGEAQNFAKATGTGQGGTASSGINSKFALGGGGASAGDGGIVTINNTNAITTWGDEAHGIFAQSVGGGGGVAGNVDRGFTSGTFGLPKLNIGVGIAVGQDGGNGGNGGAVSIANSGSITTHGQGAFGILAQSIGGGGGAAGGLGNDGTFLAPILSLQNFYGSAGGNGDAGIVTVNQTGDVNVTGSGSIGIFAQSTTTNGVGKAVNITVNGNINATQPGSFGILAQSLGTKSADHTQSSDDISITVNGGTIRGGRGSFAAEASAAVIAAETNNDKGAAIDFRDGRNNTLVNRGTIGDTDLSRMAILGEAGNEAISNFGTIAGNVNLGAGKNSLTNNSGGVLATGASINLGAGGILTNSGVLSVAGTGVIGATGVSGGLNQTSAGQLRVDIDTTTGAADRVTVTGGTAAIAGSLSVNRLNISSVKPGIQQFVLVSAANGVTSSALSISAQQSAVTSYSVASGHRNAAGQDTDLILSIETDFASPPSGKALHGNELAIGSYINSVQAAGSSPTLEKTVNRIISLSDTKQLTAAYQQLNPEGYASSEMGAVATSMQFGDALLSCKMRDGQYHFTSEGQCGWIALTRQRQRQDVTASQNGFDRDGNAIAGGLQFAITDNWRVGFGGEYNTDDLKTDHGGKTVGEQTAHGETGYFGLVAKGTFGNALIAASLSGGRGEFDSRRQGLFDSTVKSSQVIDAVAAQIRGAYTFDWGNWFIRPMVDVNGMQLHRHAFDETGAGANNLKVLAANDTFVAIQPAVETGFDIPLFDNTIRWFAKLGATKFVSGTNIGVSAAFEGAPIGVAAFTATQQLDRSATDVGVGIDILSKYNAVLRIVYDAQFAKHSSEHGGAVKLSIPF